MIGTTLFLAVSVESVQAWMTAGGYFVLFGLLFACGLGLPLPEDIPLLAAGVLIANGKMNLPMAGVFAWCGIIGGDVCLYHLGKRFGLNITKVPFVGRHVTRKRIERAEALFERYGVWVVAVGRLFAGIRGAMVVAAGAIRFKFVKFMIADGIAALVSGGLFLLLGKFLGNELRDHEAEIARYKTFFFIGGVALVALFIVVARIRHRRALLEAEVEAEAPEASLSNR